MRIKVVVFRDETGPFVVIPYIGVYRPIHGTSYVTGDGVWIVIAEDGTAAIHEEMWKLAD